MVVGFSVTASQPLKSALLFRRAIARWRAGGDPAGSYSTHFDGLNNFEKRAGTAKPTLETLEKIGRLFGWCRFCA